jgi:hypothetical protein
MNPSVSAVIATIGRPSLSRAVQSVLDQTSDDQLTVIAKRTYESPFLLTTESWC